MYDTSSESEVGENLDLEKLEPGEKEEVELLQEEELDLELDLEKEQLRGEATYINEQILALGELHATYITARNNFVNGSYDYYVLDREKAKVDRVRKLYEHRAVTRERIIQGERFSLDTQSDTDISDRGYSDIEDFQEEKDYLRKHITKRKNRQPKLDKVEFEPEQIRIREEEIMRQRLLEEEERERQQLTVEAELRRIEEEEVQQQEEVDEQEGNQQRNNMAQQLRWSVQSVSKFYGENGQNANSHLFEFNDFLRADRIEAGSIDEGTEDERNASNIINDFVTTLKGKARLWFDVNIPKGNRNTVAHWNAIKIAFEDHFHPLESTRKQRVKAWKDMKWDPTIEAIEDFSY